MKPGRLPTALLLPYAMIGTSARPSGSSGEMVHRLCEQVEGATRLNGPTRVLHQRIVEFASTGTISFGHASLTRGPQDVGSSAISLVRRRTADDGRGAHVCLPAVGRR